MKHVVLQPAYILHRRSYRESSLLVELFTSEHGCLTVVAKGVRKTRSVQQALLQPFIPLLVSWVGKGELMTLSQVEMNGVASQLTGECLFAGFYLNELLLYLLPKWDAHPALYEAYQNALLALRSRILEQKILRAFEKHLLTELGYGLLSTESSFLQEQYYKYIPEQGFMLIASPQVQEDLLPPTVFSGKSLLDIAQENWQDENSLRDAKRLMRMMLTGLLGKQSINSRSLFKYSSSR
jgi:DNA repair protein RecO (recombination protein O)